jgi:hypothetical protein
VDPWRPDTPHSDDVEWREDTVLRPFKLIPSMTSTFFFKVYQPHSSLDGVHHYDEYGLANLLEEPAEIRKIHAEMISFVNSWLRDWNVEHGIDDTVMS